MLKKRSYLLGILCGCVLISSFVGYLWWSNQRVLWTFPLRERILGTPTICSNGSVIDGGDDKVYAVDSESGHLRWIFDFSAIGEIQMNNAVAGNQNMVFLPTSDRNKSRRIYAFDSLTGSKKWVANEDATIVAVGDNNRICAGHFQALGLDGMTGSRVWDYQPHATAATAKLLNPHDPDNDGHIADLSIVQGVALVAFGGPYEQLVAIDSTNGKYKWSLNTHTYGDITDIIGTDSNRVCIAGGVGDVTVVDLATGNRIWSVSLTGTLAHVTASSGVLYVTVFGGHIYALDEATGQKRWERTIADTFDSEPVLGGSNSLYIGTGSNRVYSLDRLTGKTLWTKWFGWSPSGIPNGGDVQVSVGSNGVVYAASTNGNLYALSPH